MKLFKYTLAACLFVASYTSMADVAVIVNKANASEISDSDINRIFLGKNKTFSSGESVTAANLKSGDDTRVGFEKKALGKNSKQVKAYWSKLIFSGKAKPLKEVGTAEEAIAFVKANPDAIAYVDASKVDDSVKVVKVF